MVTMWPMSSMKRTALSVSELLALTVATQFSQKMQPAHMTPRLYGTGLQPQDRGCLDMADYPNPCDTCEEAATCARGYGCEEWKNRYLYRQKQINARAKQQASGSREKQTSFAYEHPDLIRRYISGGPCAECKAQKVCDTPCPSYWRWWDARMEIARKKAGL